MFTTEILACFQLKDDEFVLVEQASATISSHPSALHPSHFLLQNDSIYTVTNCDVDITSWPQGLY